MPRPATRTRPFFSDGAFGCRYDYTSKVDLVPESERGSALLKGTLKLDKDNLLFGQYFITQSVVSTTIAPVPYGALTATFHSGLGCLVAPSLLYFAVRAIMGA